MNLEGLYLRYIYKAMDEGNEEMLVHYQRKYNKLLGERKMERLGIILALMVVFVAVAPVVYGVLKVWLGW